MASVVELPTETAPSTNAKTTQKDDDAMKAKATPHSDESLSAAAAAKEPTMQPAVEEVYSIAPERQETPTGAIAQEVEPSSIESRKGDGRLAIPTVNTTTEAASSPSSTVGPYSTNTPHPNQHSPDTSPDEESFSHDTSLLPEHPQSRSDAASEQVGEAGSTKVPLKPSSRVAHESTPETPDAQLRLEDEQALRSAQNAKSTVQDDGSSKKVAKTALSTQPTEANEARPMTNGIKPPVQVDAEDAVTDKSFEKIDLKVTVAPNQSPLKPRDRQPTPPPEVDMPDAPDASNGSQTAPSQQASQVEKLKATVLNPKQESQITKAATPVPEEAPNASKNAEGSSLANGVLQNGALTPVSGAVLAPELPHRRSPSKDKGKRKLSKVIFDSQKDHPASGALQLYSEDYVALKGASTDEKKDYLLSLFTHQAYQPPRSAALQDLLHSANKTVSTSSYTAYYREYQDNAILKRIYNLQNANRWPLRQLQKAPEPPRPDTYLDHLLASMKWMSTDFREERKWKRAAAKSLAALCAEWVSSDADHRRSMQVKLVTPQTRPTSRAGQGSIDRDEMVDAPTPDLVHSVSNETESDILDDDEFPERFPLVTPADLFSYGYDDVVIKIDHTPSAEGLLLEIPAYDPREKRPPSRPSSATTPEPQIEPYIVETSRFVKGKLQTTSVGPPKKRSRYEYKQEEDGLVSPKRHSPERSIPSTPGGRRLHRNDLSPESSDCALFRPENRHVRDRLHAGHAFRPPSEFPMPSVNFFESRSSSQWLWEEDQKLRTSVKEFAFNWSVVSDQLSFPSAYSSGAERRTPWECFERWVQLEGLPADMSKTQYFRTYQSRLEAAQRTVSAQHQAAQQQQLAQQGQTNSQALNTPIRRRTAQPYRVERRRANRHLALIDAMRKLARKRESAAHKQQEGMF